MQEKYNMFGFELGMEPGPKKQMNNCSPYQLRHQLINKEWNFSLYLDLTKLIIKYENSTIFNIIYRKYIFQCPVTRYFLK